MKCTISNRALRATAAKIGLSTGHAVKIEARNDGSIFVSQRVDDNHWAGARVQAKSVANPGTVYAPYTLIELIQNSDESKDVELDCPKAGGLIHVKGAGRGIVKFKHQRSWDDLPVPEDASFVATDLDPRRLLPVMAAATRIARPQGEEPRSQYVQLYGSPDTKTLNVVANDGYVMYHSAVPGEVPWSGEVSLFDPTKVVHLLQNCGSESQISFCNEPNLLWCRVDDQYTWVRKGGIPGINWQAMMEIHGSWEIKVELEALQAALKRCSLVTESPRNEIRIILGDKTAEAQASHRSRGTMLDHFSFEWATSPAPGTEMLLSSYSLSRVLGALAREKGDVLIVSGSTIGKPMWFRYLQQSDTQVMMMQLGPSISL